MYGRSGLRIDSLITVEQSDNETRWIVFTSVKFTDVSAICYPANRLGNSEQF